MATFNSFNDLFSENSTSKILYLYMLCLLCYGCLRECFELCQFFVLMPFSFSSVDGIFWLMTTGTLEKTLTIHSPLFFLKITLTSSHFGFKCTEST